MQKIHNHCFWNGSFQ